MRIIPVIHEFFVEGGNREVSHALLHITEPSSPEEEKKGYFFALAEIENGTTEQVEHLQKMIDDLESNYYQTQAASGKDPFEITLEYINRRGHRVLENSQAMVHCFAGVVRGHDVVFAYHGAPQVYLFYRGKDGLSSTQVAGDEDGATAQLFSSILQGSINPGDYFFAATPHVNDNFSPDRLAKILSSRGAEETIEHIEKVLRDLRGSHSFAGVLLSLPERRFSPTMTTKKDAEGETGDSVVKLVNAEKTTDELLSPSLFGDTRKKLQTILTAKKDASPAPTEPSSETNYRPRKNAAAQNVAGMILVALGKALVVGSLGMLHAVKNISIWVVSLLRNVFYVVTNYRQKRRDVFANWKRGWHHRRVSFRSLPLLSKLLLVGTVVFVSLFAGTLYYIRWNENKDTRLQAYAARVHAITSKTEEAEGSMIYGNTDQAFILLQEASGLLRDLPHNTPEEKDTFGRLTGDIDNSLRKIRKFAVIFPTVFFDLTTLAPSAAAEKLVLIDDALLAYGPRDTALYSVNLATQKGDVKDHSTIAGLRAATTPKENDRVVFVSGPSTVAEYSPATGGLTAKNISFPVEGVSIADAFVYNQRLYTLDPAQKNIYRHSRTQTGYDQGAIWSKDGQESLERATGLAIDGDLYILLTDGVVRYANGKIQAFPITGLDPALENPTAIWTYSDVNNVYILEPANKRVIVVTKEGKLVAQYTSIEWKNPTGMVVAENDKKIYVLDSNVIYQFPL